MKDENQNPNFKIENSKFNWLTIEANIIIIVLIGIVGIIGLIIIIIGKFGGIECGGVGVWCALVAQLILIVIVKFY